MRSPLSMKRSDSRLTEERDGGRGCGGIALLWHKSVAATPISGITLDRICGIRCMVDNGENSFMSVIGVYLPCLDLVVDCYRGIQSIWRGYSVSHSCLTYLQCWETSFQWLLSWLLHREKVICYQLEFGK